jgi:MFS family permease
MISAFKYKDYTLFWIGGAFSNIGMWTLIHARLWLMNDLTDSELMLGLVTMSGLGPTIVLSVWGGVLADRINRLKLVMISRACFAILAFLTAGLIMFGIIAPWHLIAISLSTGVLLSFDIPSRHAMLPNLVDKVHMVNAIALYSFLSVASSILGPGFFGPLVHISGIEGLFILIGISYLLTVYMMSLMDPRPHGQRPTIGNMTHDLLDGLLYVKTHKGILTLLIMGIVAGIFGQSFINLLPVFAKEVLKSGVNGYSLLLFSLGIGGIIGVLLVAGVAKSRSAPVFLISGGIGFSLFLLAFSQSKSILSALILIALLGLFELVFQTMNKILVQSMVDEKFRGRVMSVHQLTWGSTAIGGLFMGSVAQLSDVTIAMLIGSITMLLVMVALSVLGIKGGYWKMLS